MLDVLQKKIQHCSTDEERINIIREALQITILKILFDRGYFEHCAFVGGTALRILFDMRRYSEDLDFSLIEKQGFNARRMFEQTADDLRKYNFTITLTSKEKRVVHSCFIKFPSLLHDLGLRVPKAQTLSIKLEIDTNPPQGWKLVSFPVTSSFFFAVKTFDLPSLFATKLHACFFRRYTKGRDFYDLVWYLGKKVVPNYVLLNNAITQTEKKDLKLSSATIKSFLLEKIQTVHFGNIRKDVERFVEDKNELILLEKGTIVQIVESLPFE